MLAKRPPYDPLLAMRRKLILEYLTQPPHITLIAGLVYFLVGSARRSRLTLSAPQARHCVAEAAQGASEYGFVVPRL